MSRDSRESRDFRDSRDSSSEKTPFVMTPFPVPIHAYRFPVREGNGGPLQVSADVIHSQYRGDWHHEGLDRQKAP